jgi:hypothetical protein
MGMPTYRALTVHTVKISVGLTFEAADQAAQLSFEIQKTKVQHAMGVIEMWDAYITGFAIDDIGGTRKTMPSNGLWRRGVWQC